MHEVFSHLGLTLALLLAPPPGPPAVPSDTITAYFENLFIQGIQPIAYAVAVFFFGWGAIELMFPNERNQERGKMAIYRAVGGLALVLLTWAITGIFQNAAK